MKRQYSEKNRAEQLKGHGEEQETSSSHDPISRAGANDATSLFASSELVSMRKMYEDELCEKEFAIQSLLEELKLSRIQAYHDRINKYVYASLILVLLSLAAIFTLFKGLS